MFNTAEAAGFRVRTVTSDPAAQDYKWHDNECKRLQQAFRAIPGASA
jgi:hypothetical protein